MAKRYELTEKQYERVWELLPGNAGDPGRTALDNHRFLNGVLWVLRSGAHWHDKPPRYGIWKSQHKRFSRWAATGIWKKLFARLIRHPDNDCVMIADQVAPSSRRQPATAESRKRRARSAWPVGSPPSSRVPVKTAAVKSSRCQWPPPSSGGSSTSPGYGHGVTYQ